MKKKNEKILYFTLLAIILTLYFSWTYFNSHREKNIEYQMVNISLFSNNTEYSLNVAVADNQIKQMTGLMGVERLPYDAGMLFVYNDYRDTNDGFWMYNTLIPLDIAFIDSNNKIVDIKTMEPCPHNSWREADKCPITYSNREYIKALEVNQGLFEKLSVKIGDTISYENIN
jgi:hypothetical protein